MAGGEKKEGEEVITVSAKKGKI